MTEIKPFHGRFIITISSLIKTSRVGQCQPLLNLPYFIKRPEVCPASVLHNYLEITSGIRADSEERLILTFTKPTEKTQPTASSQILGRWVKKTLFKSGVDTTIFNAHTTRHASTLAAAGLSFDAK